MAEIEFRVAVRDALAEELERDERVIFFGEDVAAAGGVFATTPELFERFGPDRVFDTPISELALAGAAYGSAIGGLRPVIEIMFGDFLPLTMDSKVEVVGRAVSRVPVRPATPAAALAILAEFGGLEHAALAGFVLGAAAERVPVLLDGAIAGSAALVAAALCPTALEYALAGHTSVEPGHAIALNSLGLRPLLGLDLRLGEGTGALLALPLVTSAARALRDVATFDSAGVTEKN